MRLATGFRNEPDKNLKLAQQRYKLSHDRHGQIAPIFNKKDEVYLDRSSLLRPTVESSAAERYNKPLPKQQGTYKFVGVNKNTLQ